MRLRQSHKDDTGQGSVQLKYYDEEERIKNTIKNVTRSTVEKLFRVLTKVNTVRHGHCNSPCQRLQNIYNTAASPLKARRNGAHKIKLT